MGTLGTFGLLAAYLLLVFGWGLILVSIRRQSTGRPWLAGRVCFYAAASLLLWCGALLVIALLVNDFSIRYVAQHSSTTMAWPYRLCAFWAGQEGSLMLWLLITATLTAGVSLSIAHRAADRFQQHVMLTCTTICALLLAGILYASNPFAPRVFAVTEGLGLNRLLRDWAMVLHPPMLFGGYSFLVVLFAIAMADANEPVRATLLARWARITWILLTVGIGLGAVWAYDELGWGGYWGWDAVENAALFPWLVGTVLIHYASNRQQCAWRITTLLAGMTFAAALLAGYIARSGAIASVHGFAPTPVAAALLISMVAVIAISFWRARRINGRWHLGDGPLAAMLLVFGVLGLVVLACTFWPIWGTLVADRPETLPASVYNQLTAPAGVVLLMCLVWCALKRISANRRMLMECALSSAAITGVVCFCLWHVLGLTGLKLFGGSLATGVGAITLSEFFARKSFDARATGKLLAHLGVVVLSFGLAYSVGEQGHAYKVSLQKGQTSSIDGMRVTLDDVDVTLLPNGTAASEVRAHLKVQTATRTRSLNPSIKIVSPGHFTDTEIDVSMGLLYDVHVVLEGIYNDQLVLSVRKNWLVSWVWAGLILLTLGGLISLRRFKNRNAASHVEPTQANHLPAETSP